MGRRREAQTASRRRHSRGLALALAAALCLAAVPAVPVAADDGPAYEHEWFAESMVGGDRGGMSAKSVLQSESAMTRTGSRYAGTVTYSDRLAIEDPAGDVLIQVSHIRLKLEGAPAAGGTALAGTFTGTVDLDEYHAVGFEQGTSGELPPTPAGIVTYAVTGHWGATLTGSRADGEILYETATRRSASGEFTVRELEWLIRPEGAEQGAQTFSATVEGAVSSGGGTTDPGVLEAVRKGMSGTETRPVLAIPAELSAKARALRDARPVGATPLPEGAVCIDLDVAGHVLDAKNRAAGLNGTSGTGAVRAVHDVWSAERAEYVEQADAESLVIALDAQSGTPGVADLVREVQAYVAASGETKAAGAALIAEWLVTARSLTSQHPSVLGSSAEIAEAVNEVPLSAGPLSDAVLAAADAPDAPEKAVTVTSFSREPDEDYGPEVNVTNAVREALARIPEMDEGLPVVSWESSAGRRTVSVSTWLAYHRDDDTLFLLAGENGPVALMDGTLAGWAYGDRRAYVVDAARVGRLLAVLPAPAALPKATRHGPGPSVGSGGTTATP